MKLATYERVTRTAAIIILLMAMSIWIYYFHFLFELIAEFDVHYTLVDIFKGWYTQILQITGEIIGVILLIVFRKRGLPVILGVCAMAIALECALDAYLLLVEYKKIFDADPADFFQGAMSLVIAAMLFFNATLYSLGATKSATLIKYSVIALILLQLFGVIVELREGYGFDMIWVERQFDFPSYLLLILVLMMSTSKYTSRLSLSGIVSTSVRDLRNSMITEGVGIDRGIVERFSDYNNNGLWCDSYTFILTTFSHGNYCMNLTPMDGDTVCRISAADNGTGMNIFRFDLTGIWFDTGDASTCDVMRFYGKDGLFIQLIVRDPYPFRPMGIPRIGAMKLTSREEGTKTHLLRTKVGIVTGFIAEHVSKFVRFIKTNTIDRIKKKKKE